MLVCLTLMGKNVKKPSVHSQIGKILRNQIHKVLGFLENYGLSRLSHFGIVKLVHLSHSASDQSPDFLLFHAFTGQSGPRYIFVG